jgi:hypothetical protein
MRTSLVIITVSLLVAVAQAQYSGGTGTADDPYQIATAADLIALGETPDDYDKHFILIADIDLDPNLPGGRAFTAALIAADTDPTLDFEGDFNGNDRKISNLMIHAEDGKHLGLFGCIGPGGRVHDLVLESTRIVGWSRAGGLAACNEGRIVTCRVSGSIEGYEFLGGLVGINRGAIADSRTAVDVRCDGEYPGDTGGLVGWHQNGTIINCSATGAVVAGDGGGMLGGLVGHNGYIGCFGPYWTGEIMNCYATGPVVAGIGADALGGLVGHDELGSFVHCYASSKVAGGENSAYLGGLVGWSMGLSHATACFWDVETSGQATSAGGAGLTTAEMQTAQTFLAAGWDFVDETENGTDDVWKIVEGKTYPLLAWQKYGGGTGEPNDPYLIYTAGHLNALGAEPNDYDKHFKLMADIDLSESWYGRAVIAPDMNDMTLWFDGTPFTGVFDGNGHTISHLTIVGGSYLGLFGASSAAMISDLALEGVDVNGTGDSVGGLVGVYGHMDSRLTRCHTSGTVSGKREVGGLVGNIRARSGVFITECSSSSVVIGSRNVGGLAGCNGGDYQDGAALTNCCSSGTVSGHSMVGGLIGRNWGSITTSYSTASVSGDKDVGGLVGFYANGEITASYSTGAVSGTDYVGGFVGWLLCVGAWTGENVTSGFWDIETCGTTTGYHLSSEILPLIAIIEVQGLTTADMQTASTFLEAGWDFIDETENGTDDVWWIDEGQDYPRLWWERGDGSPL